MIYIIKSLLIYVLPILPIIINNKHWHFIHNHKILIKYYKINVKINNSKKKKKKKILTILNLFMCMEKTYN